MAEGGSTRAPKFERLPPHVPSEERVDDPMNPDYWHYARDVEEVKRPEPQKKHAPSDARAIDPSAAKDVDNISWWDHPDVASGTEEKRAEELAVIQRHHRAELGSPRKVEYITPRDEAPAIKRFYNRGIDTWLEDNDQHPARLNPEYQSGPLAEDERARPTAWEASRSLRWVHDDIQDILTARRDPERPFTRKSAEVFLRTEALAIAAETERIMLVAGHYVHKTSDLIQYVPATDDAPEEHTLREVHSSVRFPEQQEEEMVTTATMEFDVLVGELQKLKDSGTREDLVFKKILDQVNAFPYRQTANSFLKALAWRNREHFRPKRNFVFELMHANELPGLNCEGRAKMFGALLEAVGYDPEKEIFVNWPEDHVQILLKQADDTWLAFEGNHRRPLIQKFTGATDGICTLQEWKYTLYGVPSSAVLESVNPIVHSEKTADKDGTPPAWEESKLAHAAADALDVMKELASLSLAGIVGAFAGTPKAEEHVASAYPTFAPHAGQNGEGQTAAGKALQEKMNLYGGHAETLQKLLAPRIAAAKRAFGGVLRPAVVSALSAGCWFSYGAIKEHVDNDREPPSAGEVREERRDWEDAANAVMRDMEVRIVPPSANDWEAQLHEQEKWAPYTYSAIDFVVASPEARIEDHRVLLSDETRAIAPGVFEGMVKQDARRGASDRGEIETTWHISGANLDIHAAQLALTQMAHTGSFLVEHSERLTIAKTLNVTFALDGKGEHETVDLRFTTQNTGEHRVLGDKWIYAADEGVADTILAVEKMEKRIVKKSYGVTHWQAPVLAMQREKR